MSMIWFHELHQILLDYNPFELKLHTLNNEEEMRTGGAIRVRTMIGWGKVVWVHCSKSGVILQQAYVFTTSDFTHGF